MQFEFCSIVFGQEKALPIIGFIYAYPRKIKRRCFIRLTNSRVLVASTVSVLRNDRLRSFRVITHASLPFCWSHQSFYPLSLTMLLVVQVVSDVRTSWRRKWFNDDNMGNPVTSGQLECCSMFCLPVRFRLSDLETDCEKRFAEGGCR